MSEFNPDSEPKIGTLQFSANYSGSYMLRTKIEENDNEFVYISVTTLHKGNRKYVPQYYSGEELTAIRKKMYIMKEYWNAYCVSKNLRGAIFIKLDALPSSLVEGLTAALADKSEALIQDTFRTLLDYNFNNKGELLGTSITPMGHTYLSPFFESKKVLDNLLIRNPLLTFRDSRANNFLLLEKTVTYHFKGERLTISMSNSFQTLYLTHYDKSESSKFVLDVDELKIQEALDTISENSRLKTLINPPRTNFDKIIKNKMFGASEDNLQTQFDKLSNILGSWEQVEEIFVSFNKQEPEHLMDVINSLTNASFQLYRMLMDNHYYFFMDFSSEQTDHNRTFEIIVSEEPSPIEVKNKILENIVDF